MDAIVFTSNTGNTEKYANLLSEAIGIPALPLKKAKGLKNGSEIIYMGWVMAGGICGYKKAKKSFNIKAVCAVGMTSPTAEAAAEISKNNEADGMKLFVLQGGFDLNKLKGFKKGLMKMMTPNLIAQLEAKGELTDGEKDTLELLRNGGSRVKPEALTEVICWYNNLK